MKIYFFSLILFFICVSPVFSQTFELDNGDTINITDQANLKQGYWKIYNKTKKIPGYNDDQLVEEGNFLNSRKEGLWKQYFPDGKIKSEFTYVNNSPNGYAKTYYRNGKLMEEGTWINNKWDGKYKYYYETGQIAYDWNFLSGKREGTQKYFHENGKINYIGDWSGGQEEGVLKEYNDKGQLVAEKKYNKGKIDTAASKYFEVTKATKVEPTSPPQEEQHIETAKEVEAAGIGVLSGYHKVMNSQSKVWMEGEFTSGYLVDGKEYQYDPSTGKLLKILLYKKSRVVGATMQ
jgi:antitoxin component YwqK of YwqJK toxin-antitoxin module